MSARCSSLMTGHNIHKAPNPLRVFIPPPLSLLSRTSPIVRPASKPLQLRRSSVLPKTRRALHMASGFFRKPRFAPAEYECVDRHGVCPPLRFSSCAFAGRKGSLERVEMCPQWTSDGRCWLLVRGLSLRDPSLAICKTRHAQNQSRTLYHHMSSSAALPGSSNWLCWYW